MSFAFLLPSTQTDFRHRNSVSVWPDRWWRLCVFQVQDLEFAQIETKVIAGLKTGNECLKKMHEVSDYLSDQQDASRPRCVLVFMSWVSRPCVRWCLLKRSSASWMRLKMPLSTKGWVQETLKVLLAVVPANSSALYLIYLGLCSKSTRCWPGRCRRRTRTLCWLSWRPSLRYVSAASLLAAVVLSWR